MSTYISEQSEWKEEWKNFELDEFKCKCGCETVKINSDIMDLIQEARNELADLDVQRTMLRYHQLVLMDLTLLAIL